jgi:HK97 family phage major capsid protein
MNQTQTRHYEIRAADKALVLEGLAVVFNEPADMGGYTEVISPAALDGLDMDGIALTISHDNTAVPLARTPKTLILTVTDKGLEMKAELPDTEQGRAAYEAVRRGDLSKMSFAFDIGEQTVNEETRTVTITAISKIYELSIVNFAAYKATSIQARAGKDVIMNNQFNPIESAVFDTTATETDTHAAKEYRTAFFKSLLGQGLNEAETRAMNAARAEKRADAFNILSNSATVVPTHTLDEIISGIHTQGGLFNEIRHFRVPSNLSVPVGTPADVAAWHVEGSAVDRTSVTTTAVTFTGYELIKIISMSAAVRRMSISAFESYVTKELAASITDAINTAIVNGTGSGQPTGLISGITWNASNSLTGTAATIANSLLALIALLPAGYINSAKFAMSNATLYGNIYSAATTSGAFIFTQDAQAGNVRRLFGFEIVTDDNIPANTILFGNFGYYGLNIPESIAVESSRESGFTSGLIDYRALCIADGKPIVPAAFVKLTIGSVS